MKKIAVLFIAASLIAGIAVPPAAGEVPAALASSWSKAIPGISFTGPGSVTLAVGKSKLLEVRGDGGEIEWQSSDPHVATVSEGGIVSAVHAGASVITARNPQTGRVAACTVKVFRKCTQKQARKAILSMRRTYHAGIPWTNDDYYYWQAGNSHCYGCVAFAAMASDRAFGKFAPLQRHASFSRIKVGDHVRIGASHSVVVLYKKKRSIIVAEGNVNGTFRWNHKITSAKLKRKGFYVETRY